MGLHIRDKVPQVELFCGEDTTAILLRHLSPLLEEDKQVLMDFAATQNWALWLQPKGPDSIYQLWPLESKPLSYLLPYELEMCFRPGDFIQVHAQVNALMIKQAMRALGVKPGLRILDAFCGLGNFTLPIARLGGKVVGVEGSESLVERALENARHNQVSATFYVADLFAVPLVGEWLSQEYDAVLIDPPRSGALEFVKEMAKRAVPLLVYVSCNPASFIRDAAYLVSAGYELTHVGGMAMFPHTQHLEVMGRFVRTQSPV